MQSARLKNIIIIILALVNLFLLGSLASRQRAQQASRQRTQEQLVSLFAADAVTLPADVISFQSPPTGGTLVRDVELDRAMAVCMLGENLTYSDQGGGIYAYDSDRGAAIFRSNGSFDATILFSVPNDAAILSEKLCETFGYANHVGDNISEAEFSSSAVRRFNGYPVNNCTISFYFLDGVLSVSGTVLPDSLTTSGSSTVPLSGTSALTAFLNARRESGAVVSSVEDMYPCYDLQNTAASAMTLVPSWCIVTGNGSYYVNCYTGVVTRS